MDVARVYISRRNEEELKKTTRRWNFFLDRETKLGGSKGMGGKEGKARKQNVRDKRTNDTQDRDRLTGFPRRGTHAGRSYEARLRGLFKPIPPIGSCSTRLNPPGNFLRPCLPTAAYHHPRHLSQIKRTHECNVASSFSLFFFSFSFSFPPTRKRFHAFTTRANSRTTHARITSQLFRNVTLLLDIYSILFYRIFFFFFSFWCYIYLCIRFIYIVFARIFSSFIFELSWVYII